MCRKLVAVWMLAIAMMLALGAGEVRAAEPVAAEAVVAAEETVVASPATVVAPEVVADAPAPAADVDPPWYLDLVEKGLNWFWEILATAIFGYALKKAGDRSSLAAAIRALEAGVNDAWYTVVKDLKSKATDGKLTKEEKANARMVARVKAKEVATGAGKKVLVALGEAGMNAIIEKIIRRVKSKTSAPAATKPAAVKPVA